MPQSKDKQPGAALRSWRRLKDRLARYVVVMGGLSVIFAVMLIMVYLFWVVLPLFKPATVEYSHSYNLPGNPAVATAHLAMEEQAEVGVRFTADGQAVFFNVADGSVIKTERVGPGNAAATSFKLIDPPNGLVAYGFADGTGILAKHAYRITYPNDQRKIDPYLAYPYGAEPIKIDQSGQPITMIAAAADESEMTFASVNAAGQVLVAKYELEESFLSGEIEVSFDERFDIAVEQQPDYLLLDPLSQWLYLGEKDGRIDFYQIGSEITLNQTVDLAPEGQVLEQFDFLMGGISLLAGLDNGRIVQWFPVRDAENNYSLKRIREFSVGSSNVTSIEIEQRRKGFVAADAAGDIALFFSTSARRVKAFELADADQQQVSRMAMSPRGNRLLSLGENQQIAVWEVENEHPEVSFSSLWGKVWYEGYQEPEHIWQSSAANNDFEPKFSLSPLAFGTLKAAFYAMLLALPLAIAGATYTAYFMSPGLRRKVKPVIEIMEALPTVILGFLAGLWLAPFFEKSLPGIFMLMVLMPLALIAFGYLWNNAPLKIRRFVASGWEPILLIPIVLGTAALAFMLDDPVEVAFFGGNMPGYLRNELGIDFDQRNSVVVGFAMGFAVIPTIFSITEDAVFGVPRHLINGSLALGATPWQTLVRVVFPTASPGMFSAVMIGMGRAVGETMIVLMATGNTPVMDWNIFEGMRTLSANIAVEMPESELHSTHYRILFLAGLVLFLFTFAVNTVAEVVRQRLRAKYSSL